MPAMETLARVSRDVNGGNLKKFGGAPRRRQTGNQPKNLTVVQQPQAVRAKRFRATSTPRDPKAASAATDGSGTCVTCKLSR